MSNQTASSPFTAECASATVEGSLHTHICVLYIYTQA